MAGGRWRLQCPVPSARAWLRVLLPFALHGLARGIDAALGILLHTSLEVPGFLGEVWSLAGADALRSLLSWTALGGVAWTLLAAGRVYREGGLWGEALEAEARGFDALYLRPLLTLLALVSLAFRSTYPYGFTLPVALTQDWGPAQDLLAAAALLAWRWPRLRVPAPGAVSLGFLAFLGYALLSPPWARDWDSHPGNEPKTLRMAVALGQGLTLDVEGVSAAMEELQPRPLGQAVSRAAGTLGGESWALLRALARGPGTLGPQAIRATRVTRQTIAGKSGGVFYVLAPGPSLLLAPVLRIDRALNLWRGNRGRLAASLLFWNALAALLVAALFLLLRDATGRPGLSALLAAGFALAPPFVFYSYQFYPEMLGALGLTLALRVLLYQSWWSGRTSCWLGLLLATLPWLHQKFLPVWGVLVVWAAARAVSQMVSLPALLGLLIPQAGTLYLTALYNFAITGSIRPDALFLAWGPGGVTSARLGQGVLGLLLDARYGILPYVPFYLLAAGGLLFGEDAAARLRQALPAVLVYYLTVASADNWSGAVCNLGRYFMPVAPYAVALAAVAVGRVVDLRGARTLVLALAGWTAWLSVALFRDPHAANDCALLWAGSAFADGQQYLPGLFIRTWSAGAPGLWVRVAVWGVFGCGVGLWLRRVTEGRGGRSPDRLWAGVAATVLGAGLLLECWPSQRRGPQFANAIEVGPGAVAFVSGRGTREAGFFLSRGGEVDLLVRSYGDGLRAVRLTASGSGVLRQPGGPALPLAAHGVTVELRLTPLRTLTGRGGARETLSRAAFKLDASDEVVLRLSGG